MDDSSVISKGRKLRESMDYAFLREKGLEYIEQLASNNWTDYNSHDPGITILEALCYAITELGYRTSFDIKDLLSDSLGNIDSDQPFFTAKSILTMKPLTVADYRKLLVDIPGVHNAFLYPNRNDKLELIGYQKQEVPIFADCKKDKLVYKKTAHKIELKGLYKVVLDLEDSDEFGDLNTGSFSWKFPIKELFDLWLQIHFPCWDQIDYDFISAANPSSISDLIVSFKKGKWTVTFEIGIGSKKINFGFESLISKGDIDSGINKLVEKELKKIENVADIFSHYQNKIRLIIKTLKVAKRVLNANRNLCEDFKIIETIKATEVAICADIEVVPNAEIEKVYANVLYQLENYLNPEIRFYLLSELLSEGITAEKIFEGPALSHGFVKNNEIEAARPRTKIFVSDIINFIMDTEGVLSVKNVLLTKYNDDGKPQLPSERWCLEIDENRKPVLNEDKSKVLFFKGKLPFIPKHNEMIDTLKYLHGKEDRGKLNGTADDIEMPKGQFRNLEEYSSVQHEFPHTYGIGNVVLPASEANLLIAQSKQLKAYLLFFDQVIADFFSQMTHAGDLFSFKKELKNTYFSQFVEDFHGAYELYRSAEDLKLILGQQQDSELPEITQARNELLEYRETFLDRRNRFLDHVIARFAESFNEYVLFLYTYVSSEKYEKIEAEELIHDKIRFINDYPVLSSGRSCAFNYLEESWDTENVSGFEKRISRLAGIDSFVRRFLFCIKNIEITKTNDSPALHYFEMRDDSGAVVLQSAKLYEKYSELLEIAAKLPEDIRDIGRYAFINISGSEFSFEIKNGNGDTVAKSGAVFTEAELRDAAVEKLIEDINADCPKEGMHLLEHILLRPRFLPPAIPGVEPEDVYNLLDVCLGKKCILCGQEDPYSFRITLVLPYWHERFRNMEFRRFFENMARTEAPAHVLLKICWISNTLMNEFEIAFENWLQALKDYQDALIPKVFMKDDIRDTCNSLTLVLKKLHSEYPEAQLHDCQEGISNPVLLGNTVLGTYKN